MGTVSFSIVYVVALLASAGFERLNTAFGAPSGFGWSAPPWKRSSSWEM